MSEQEIKNKSLRVEVLEKIGQLVASGFGLVAALAWNDFIKNLFSRIFPEPKNNLFAMFAYALLITILVVVATLQLGRLLEIAKRQLAQEKKKDNLKN